MWWHTVTHGRGSEWESGEWSTLHTTSEHGLSSITTADAHTSAASRRLNWRPRRFKWTRLFHRKTKYGFCAWVPSHFNWPLHSVNSNSCTSRCQCSQPSKKNPIIRIFFLSGWLGFPFNQDKCSSTVNKNKEIWLPKRYRTLKIPR